MKRLMKWASYLDGVDALFLRVETYVTSGRGVDIDGKWWSPLLRWDDGAYSVLLALVPDPACIQVYNKL
jgi:hypothetical protein